MRIIILILFFSVSCTAQPYFGRLVVTPAVDTSLNDVNIVADGNSYFTNYEGAICSPNVLITLSPFATNGATLSNFGVSGQTTGQMLSDEATQILPLYNSSVKNVLVINEGINDLYTYGRVDSAIARMTRYCNNAKAVGFKVIVATLIKVASVADSLVANYNSQLLSLTGVYDAVIRPDLESIFATFSSGGYLTDNIHPNQTGHNKYADLYKTAILNL